MVAIRYHTTDARELERIRPLWERLRAFHAACLPDLRDRLGRMTFEERSDALQRKAAGGLLWLEIAQADGDDIGYCVSTISEAKAGEIDMIYVDEACRGRGVGTALMEHALRWLEERRADPISLSVGVGNEGAIVFYRRFGFFPRHIVLERKVDGGRQS